MGMLKILQTVELEAIVFQWEIESMENSARIICIKFYPLFILFSICSETPSKAKLKSNWLISQTKYLFCWVFITDESSMSAVEKKHAAQKGVNSHFHGEKDTRWFQIW